MQISVKTDIRGAQRFLTNLQRKVIPAATASAINKSLDNTRAEATRRVSKASGLKQSSVRSRFRTQKATRSRLTGKIELHEGRFPNLASYGGKQVKGGVTAKAWGRTKTYRGAFLIERPWGKIAVTRKTAARNPLKALYGASLVKEMKRTNMQKHLENYARDRFKRNFAHELQRRIAQLKSSA